MEMKYSQRVLRKKFLFRILVFAISLSFFIYYWKTGWTGTIPNIFLGVSGSLCAWALVELIDFFVETGQRYWDQRNQFILMINGYWHEMTIPLKEEYDNISYDVVKSVVDRMYNEVALFPFKAEVYTLSKEWEQLANYITRLQEAFWANYFYGLGFKNDLIEKRQYLYSILVKEEKLSPNPIKYKNDIDEIVKQAEKFSRVDITFEKLQENRAIRHTTRGLIRETFDILEAKVTLYSLKPQLDFEEKILSNNKKPCFLTVMKIMFRKVQF